MELSDKFINPYTVKCIIVGDYNVGKSTMINILSTGRIGGDVSSTIGISFVSKLISLPEYNNQGIKLQVWDTAGSCKYRAIVKQYFHDIFIAFIVFDITNRESWDSVDYWKEELDSNKKYNSTPIIVLVGTKSDLRNHVVECSEINEKATMWGCKHYIISSKQDNSASTVYRMFLLATKDLHQNITQDQINGTEIPEGIMIEDKKHILNLFEYDTNRHCCVIT